MCDTTAFNDYIGRLEDYLEYVNTDVDRLMTWEPDLYAAYAVHNNLPVETIKEWYEEAEDMFVSAWGIDLYIQKKYDVWSEEDIDYYYEKEVHRDGTLYECGGFWFRSE